MGDWSTCTSFSKRSRFSMWRCFPGMDLAPLSLRAAAAARTSLTSVLLPEPDTPVTTVSRPTGKRASTSRRLLARASRTVRKVPSLFLVFASLVTRIFRARYGPVRETEGGAAMRAAGGPWKRSCPPSVPAWGPSSMISSAMRMVSSSCSTTRTVLPRSRSSRRVSRSFWLSCGCKPMLGSSRT